MDDDHDDACDCLAYLCLMDAILELDDGRQFTVRDVHIQDYGHISGSFLWEWGHHLRKQPEVVLLIFHEDPRQRITPRFAYVPMEIIGHIMKGHGQAYTFTAHEFGTPLPTIAEFRERQAAKSIQRMATTGSI